MIVVMCENRRKVNGHSGIRNCSICGNCGNRKSNGLTSPSCKIFVITGPVGFGCPNVAEMIGITLGIRQVVLYTTRPRRKNEVNGQEFTFVSPDTFFGAFDREEFLWSAEFQGNFYGMKYVDIERMIQTESGIYLIADRIGAEEVKERYGENVVRIFIYDEASSAETLDLEYKTKCEHVFQNIDFPHLMFDLAKTLHHYLQYDLVEDF